MAHHDPFHCDCAECRDEYFRLECIYAVDGEDDCPGCVTDEPCETWCPTRKNETTP